MLTKTSLKLNWISSCLAIEPGCQTRGCIDTKTFSFQRLRFNKIITIRYEGAKRSIYPSQPKQLHPIINVLK